MGMFAIGFSEGSLYTALPAIFRGIGVASWTSTSLVYLLWIPVFPMLLFPVLASNIARMKSGEGGSVYLYRMGGFVFSAGASALFIDPFNGYGGALWMVIWRIIQAIGAVMITATYWEITSALSAKRFSAWIVVGYLLLLLGDGVGLATGGLLASVSWRLVFAVLILIGVPSATLPNIPAGHAPPWATDEVSEVPRDWLGSGISAITVTAFFAALAGSIQPYGRHLLGWSNPALLAWFIVGVVGLIAFYLVEYRLASPMVNVKLLRSRGLRSLCAARLLLESARGSLLLLLLCWLLIVWLPQNGHGGEDGPLWSGLLLLPIPIGSISGRQIASWVLGESPSVSRQRSVLFSGLLLAVGAFIGILRLPTNFNYAVFAVLIFLAAAGIGVAANLRFLDTMPIGQRAEASRVVAFFEGIGYALSAVLFFSLTMIGISASLPRQMFSALVADGVPDQAAQYVSSQSPAGMVSSAFLGNNPVTVILARAGALAHLPPRQAAVVNGSEFFPKVISGPFHDGLSITIIVIMVLLVIAAILAPFYTGSRD